jgi:hypothetical protein
VSEALFPDDDLRVAPSHDDPELTYGERQRRRQGALIANGYHPLAGPLRNRLRLHPDADRAQRREDPQSGPTCGSCVFRVLMGGHAKDFPKCVFGTFTTPVTEGMRRTYPLLYRGVAADAVNTHRPRVTHADATDVKAWWPACTDHQPKPDPDGSTA